ncbi:Beta-amylase [Bertholletia excelsa]
MEGDNDSDRRRRKRSMAEKEKTKMRERQRRSITTKIFHGLRKHGHYPLSPRSDINHVLRHLAMEAGWVVEPDGTTYRATPLDYNICPLCGARKRSDMLTPTSNVVVEGGDCSTANIRDLVATNFNDTTTLYYYFEGGGGIQSEYSNGFVSSLCLNYKLLFLHKLKCSYIMNLTLSPPPPLT